NALVGQLPEQRVSEMQPRSGRGDRTGLHRVDRLVVVQVLRADFAPDVMRQREQPRGSENLIDRDAVLAGENRTALPPLPHDPERVAALEDEARTLFEA